MATVKIENRRACVHHIGPDITLAPKVNEVDAEAWAKVRELPVVVSHLQKRNLIEVDVGALSKNKLAEGGTEDTSFKSRGRK